MPIIPHGQGHDDEHQLRRIILYAVRHWQCSLADIKTMSVREFIAWWEAARDDEPEE